MQKNYPTPYPEVNTIVDHLFVNIKKILGEQFVGLYLHGSLITGDFNLESSDIDFLCVTKKNSLMK
ncbi:MAG: nucleotidyltransferase domain-containing protein [Anaerolineae bacterium]|nr:nucleotidyltransferase domain-containing protein [Anaerolineae bacterium]MBT4311423.1 nucleotidyltransferase domain-containing protein [Anaerolineae bacterium]MBT4459150.1 nucleotidyltransferase domain-containing protein [Anaerolineae bacterium]MBT4841485.1 nucleotidyltransferase domain-containing protein [Anaerolineae bacterium]MBT6061616.1 nucleotidyltransferase domain-containing protein [Anaerolineae bacterium]